MFEIGSRVRLRSFDGTCDTPADTVPSEDYWRLIGTTGTVRNRQSSREAQPRVLVQFHADVASMGLDCHNPIENALWVCEGDLASEPG